MSVTGISSWYFSWTSSDPHRSGFKLHIIIIIIIIIINYHRVTTRWQLLFYMYTKYEIGYY